MKNRVLKFKEIALLMDNFCVDLIEFRLGEVERCFDLHYKPRKKVFKFVNQHICSQYQRFQLRKIGHCFLVGWQGNIKDRLDVLDENVVQASNEILGSTQTGQCIACMVDISVFPRFIPESSLFEILAVEQNIALQVLLQVEQVIFIIDFPIEIVVDDVEDTSDPMGIARVDQLVCSSIEPSKFSLSLRKPKHQSRYIKIFKSFQQSQGCDSTKSESSVCFSTYHIGNSSFVALRKQDSLSNSLQDIPWQVEGYCDQSYDEYCSQIALSFFVHHKLAALLAFFEELIDLGTIEEIVCLRTQFDDREESSVGWSQMRQLHKASTKALAEAI